MHRLRKWCLVLVLGLFGVTTAVVSNAVLMDDCAYAACTRATTYLNWPSKKKTEWKVETLKSSQITQTAKFSVPSGFYVQGAVVTEKYYVFAVFKNNDAQNYVYFANRSNNKVVKKIKGNWGHMNALYYKWGSKHVRIRAGSKSADGCYNTETFAKVSINNCKTDRSPDYGTKGLTSQGEATAGNYVYTVGWDAYCHKYGKSQPFTYGRHHTALFIYEKGSKKLKKTFFISNKITNAEIEDVSIDGNGDLYLFYNFTHTGGGARFFRINKSVIGYTEEQAKNQKKETGGSNGGGKDNSGSSGNKKDAGGSSGNKKNASDNTDDSSESPYTSDGVQLDPGHEAKCATILGFWCDSAEDDGEKTIRDIIGFVIGTMTIGITTLGTVGIIHAGYLIMTARDNAEQARRGRTRIVEVALGLILWVLMAMIVHLILPTTDSGVNDALYSATVKVVGYDKM